MKLLIAISVLILLCGCSGSTPGCSDQEVTELIRKIFKDNNIELINIRSVRTIEKTNNVCSCSALATIKHGLEQRESGINYLIELADNKEEFTVQLEWQ